MTESSTGPERIHRLSNAFAKPLILEAAVKNDVFDLLASGPMALETLAARSEASRRGLRALLDALVGLEFLTKVDQTYALTRESERFLVSSAPEYQGGIFHHISSQLMPNWLHLAETVRTGQPPTQVNREQVGGEFFRRFVEDLFPRNYPAAQELADAIRVAGATQPLRVLDVAAGSAVWSIAMAEKSPHVRVTVVDWPTVIPVAQQVTARHGVDHQYEFVEGDLLETDFGTGHHVATLGHILHSEGPQRSQALLHKVFGALAVGGTIAIAEMIPNDDRTGPLHALIFAVNMLVHTDDGDVFTFREMSQWLIEAGFVNPRQLDVPAPSPLVLADKP